MEKSVCVLIHKNLVTNIIYTIYKTCFWPGLHVKESRHYIMHFGHKHDSQTKISFAVLYANVFAIQRIHQWERRSQLIYTYLVRTQ